MVWNNLNSIAGLEALIAASAHKPQLIFKHSTRCGISAGAKNRLEQNLAALGGEFDLHYLDLLSYRDVSNKIAERLGVRHESPQVVGIFKGQAVFNMSHEMITAQRILGMVPK